MLSSAPLGLLRRYWGGPRLESHFTPCGPGGSRVVSTLAKPQGAAPLKLSRSTDCAERFLSCVARTSSCAKPRLFRSGARLPHDEMIAFIDTHRDRVSRLMEAAGLRGAPMWCVKRLRVAVLMVVGCRGCGCGSWRAGSGCGGGPGRERPGYDVCLGRVCAGSRPGRRGRSAVRRRRTGTWRA